MPKGEHLKGKGGVKFGQGQDPTKGGKKKDRINEIWQIVTGSPNDEERVILLSKSEKYKLIEVIFELPLSKLQDIISNENTPAFVVNIAMAIVGDIEERKTFTIDKYFDRFFGKAGEKLDITTKGEAINEMPEWLKKMKNDKEE